jgi:hypothetical protein
MQIPEYPNRTTSPPLTSRHQKGRRAYYSSQGSLIVLLLVVFLIILLIIIFGCILALLHGLLALVLVLELSPAISSSTTCVSQLVA